MKALTALLILLAVTLSAVAPATADARLAQRPWAAEKRAILQMLAKGASCSQATATPITKTFRTRAGRKITRVVGQDWNCIAIGYSYDSVRTPAGYSARGDLMPATADCSSYAGWLVYQTTGFDLGRTVDGSSDAVWTGRIFDVAKSYTSVAQQTRSRTKPAVQVLPYSGTALRPGDILMTANPYVKEAHAVVYIGGGKITQASVKWAEHKRGQLAGRKASQRNPRPRSSHGGSGFVTVDRLTDYLAWYNGNGYTSWTYVIRVDNDAAQLSGPAHAAALDVAALDTSITVGEDAATAFDPAAPLAGTPLAPTLAPIDASAAPQAVTFTWTATEPGGRFECAIDTSAWVPCVAPYRITNLPAGPHTFQVRQVNDTGSGASSSLSW